MPQILQAEIDGLSLKAQLYPPKATSKNITLFCLSGGGLTQDYFDLAPNFSFTVRMQALGYAVMIMDNIGIGNNAVPDDFPFHTPRQSAGYLARALETWTQDGHVKGTAIGVGHSMGGMMIMLMQGGPAPFAGLGLFGSSAGGLDWGLSEAEKLYIDKEAEFERDLEALSLAKFKGLFSKGTGGPSGTSIVFGGETAGLNQRLRDISCGMNSAAAMMSMTRGSFQTEVLAINVPMFFAFGDHDIGIPPEDAPKAFINAPSTETVILDMTGHNHFAFTSIETLCQKFDYWASNLA